VVNPISWRLVLLSGPISSRLMYTAGTLPTVRTIKSLSLATEECSLYLVQAPLATRIRVRRTFSSAPRARCPQRSRGRPILHGNIRQISYSKPSAINDFIIACGLTIWATVIKEYFANYFLHTPPARPRCPVLTY